VGEWDDDDDEEEEEEEVYRKKESRMTRLSLIAVGRAIRVFQFSGGRRPQAISSTTPPPSRRTSVYMCVCVSVYIYVCRRWSVGDVNRSRRASTSLATEQNKKKKNKKKQPCQPLCNVDGGEDDRTHTHARTRARIAASHRTFFAKWKCLYSDVYNIILLLNAPRSPPPKSQRDVKSSPPQTNFTLSGFCYSCNRRVLTSCPPRLLSGF